MHKKFNVYIVINQPMIKQNIKFRHGCGLTQLAVSANQEYW